MAIDWKSPYSASWHVRKVDGLTWDASEELRGIIDVTVSRDAGSALLESVTLTMDMGVAETIPSGWWRVTADAVQGGTSESVNIATFAMVDASGTWERGLRTVSATGLSVLYPASVRHLGKGSYAPMGADGAAWAVDMLSQCIAAPVSAAGSFVLSRHVVFDAESTYLDAVRLLLDAAGWRLRVNGRGEVLVCPPATEAGLEVTPANVMDGIGYDDGTADIPNTYTAIEDGRTVQAVNDDPNSQTSTVSRGIIVDVIDASPVRIDNESLEAYAQRKLDEARTGTLRSYSYERDFAADTVPGDLVHANVPQAGLDSVLRVKSQTIKCAAGMIVEETADLEGIA